MFRARAQPPDEPGLGKIIPAQPEPIPELGPVRDAINRLNNPLGKVDLPSPEKTVRTLVWAGNNIDVAVMRQCIFNAKPLEKSLPKQKLWREDKSYKGSVAHQRLARLS